jgi:hypothetical protein
LKPLFFYLHSDCMALHAAGQHASM